MEIESRVLLTNIADLKDFPYPDSGARRFNCEIGS